MSEPLDTEAFIEKVAELVRGLLEDSPACHDWDHTLRVWTTARKLAAAEGANAFIVDVAALMHDIGRPAELLDQGKTDHAALGAEMARRLLREWGLHDTALIDAIVHCIHAHRYRQRAQGVQPQTLEAKIVFDADKLDGMGAIGIARSFHFAGRIGARVHNTAEEALSEGSYSRQDSAYREYLVKLRYLKDKMMTASGREMALERHRFMETFFDELNREAFS